MKWPISEFGLAPQKLKHGRSDARDVWALSLRAQTSFGALLVEHYLYCTGRCVSSRTRRFQCDKLATKNPMRTTPAPA